MFDGDGTLTAVLDWELATLGDPLADFSYLAMQWMMPADGGAGLAGHDLGVLGIPTLEQAVQRYSDRSGVPVRGQLDWYFAYNLFRLAGDRPGDQEAGDRRDRQPCEGGGNGKARADAGRGGMGLREESRRLDRPTARLNARQPVRLGLVEVVIFEDQVDAVGRPRFSTACTPMLLTSTASPSGEMIADAVDVEGHVVVGLQRHVDLVRPFRRRIGVAVRVDHAAGRHARQHHAREAARA